MNGSPIRKPFRAWLRAQRKRDDPIGDLARDYVDMVRITTNRRGMAITPIGYSADELLAMQDPYAVASQQIKKMKPTDESIAAVLDFGNWRDPLVRDALFEAWMEWSGRVRRGRFASLHDFEIWGYQRSERIELRDRLIKERGLQPRSVRDTPRSRTVSLRLRFRVLTSSRFRCVYCGVTATDAALVVDHVKPWARGGITAIENLVAACVPCNSGKSDMELPEDVAPKQGRSI